VAEEGSLGAIGELSQPQSARALPLRSQSDTISGMNYRFSALITKEDDWYVARCPELGVTSQGKDVESARTNLREAIELYLETWGAPEPPSNGEASFWTVVEISK